VLKRDSKTARSYVYMAKSRSKSREVTFMKQGGKYKKCETMMNHECDLQSNRRKITELVQYEHHSECIQILCSHHDLPLSSDTTVHGTASVASQH
jgi:hypothetical protein